MLRRIGFLLLACWPFTAHGQPSVAFYYGTQLPLEKLAAFDWLVVEPRHVTHAELAYLHAANVTVFAYVSLGEWNGEKEGPCATACRSLGHNAAWNSFVADQTDLAWQNYILKQQIPALIEQGYRHFFLDTLDSYLLFVTAKNQIAAQRAAQLKTIQAITRDNPGVKLMVNRGFDLFPPLQDDVVAVVAESLYHRWDATEKTYSPQPQKNTDWLLAQLDIIKNTWHLPVVVVDYVDVNEKRKAGRIARRIKKQGFIPWVANSQLDEVGVGASTRRHKNNSRDVSPPPAAPTNSTGDDGA